MNLKKYISPKNILTLFVVVFFVVIVFRLINVWSFPDTSWEIGKDDDLKLKPHQSIIQLFTPTKDNLSRIEILFPKSDSIKPGGKMVLEINETDCETTIRKSSVRFKTLTSDKTYHFIFEKIPDSKDRAYCLKLSFIPRKESSKSARVFLIEHPTEKEMAVMSQSTGKIYPNFSLSMRPSYQKNNWEENIQTLVQRISQYKPWFLKGAYLFTIAVLSLILSFAVVIILITI